MDSMIYPTLTIVRERGLIPNIHLPLDYEELVPEFYRQGRKLRVEEYAISLEEFLKGTSLETTIKLLWDNRQGLTNIGVGISGGLDLTDSGWPCYQEHNLGTRTSLVSGVVAMKYVSQLLQSREDKINK